MNIVLKPFAVSGTVQVPPSKSLSQRALAAALLHEGQSFLRGIGSSDDEMAALNIIRACGAKVENDGAQIVVSSSGKLQVPPEVHFGESGLAARLFTPILACATDALTLSAGGSLQQRSMQFFESVLPHLGVSVSMKDHRFPMHLRGRLHPKSIAVSGAQGSQYISGLLFAFSFFTKEKIVLTVEDAVSKPYIDLSLQVLHAFGGNVSAQDHRVFEILPAAQTGAPLHYTVESDWSSAAFWLCAAALRGEITVAGLNSSSAQADRYLLEILSASGAAVNFSSSGTLHVKHERCNAFSADLTDCPDLFPVLAVFAAGCTGQSALKGTSRLRNKESDRLAEILLLLHALGVASIHENDTLKISGRTSFLPNKYACPPDHRMAMAAALGAMLTPGETTIQNASSVQKSYPEFWNDLRRCTYTLPQ